MPSPEILTLPSCEVVIRLLRSERAPRTPAGDWLWGFMVTELQIDAFKNISKDSRLLSLRQVPSKTRNRFPTNRLFKVLVAILFKVMVRKNFIRLSPTHLVDLIVPMASKSMSLLTCSLKPHLAKHLPSVNDDVTLDNIGTKHQKRTRTTCFRFYLVHLVFVISCITVAATLDFDV